MTLAEDIREMEDDELAEFLLFRIPDECEGCKDKYERCLFECKNDKRVERMIARLQEEVE